jgi:hypothetical protein
MSQTKPNPEIATPSWRTHLALALLVTLALLGIVRGILYYQPEAFLAATRQDRSLPMDPTGRTGRNLRCLRADLPTGEVVGFTSDQTGLAHLERLRQAQYFLVPLLLDDSSDHRLVVAIFSRSLESLPPAYREYQVVRDCANGVYLLRAPLQP